MESLYLDASASFTSQDDWAKARIDYILAFMHMHHFGADKAAPPTHMVAELLSLVQPWHASQDAKAQVWPPVAMMPESVREPWSVHHRGAEMPTATITDQPTGETIKLSDLPSFALKQSTVDRLTDPNEEPGPDFIGHAPADPGIQAEADPWLVIVRWNGHAFRVWDSGRLEYSDHPARLFEPYDVQRGIDGHFIWFDAFGWRFVIDTVVHTVIRVPLDSAGRAMHGFKAALDVQPEALTWWPG